MKPAVAPPDPEPRLRKAPWRSIEFLSLDFEATGLDFGRDRIVSFGAVPIRGGGIELADSVYELVDPGDVAPSRESIVVHGLRPVDLAGATSIDAARATLARCIEARYLVMWWAPVETAFLDSMFGGGRKAWLRRAVDVRDLVLGLEGRAAAEMTLSEAAELFSVPVASPHNALDDALVTAQLFLVTATKLGRRARTVGDMQALQPRRRPARGSRSRRRR